MAIEIPNQIKKPLRRKLFDDENIKLHRGLSSATSEKRNIQSSNSDNSPPAKQSVRNRSTPLSERQQIALLRQLTASENPKGEALTGEGAETSSPRSDSPHSVGKRNERGETPLHLATIKGDIKEVNRLLDQGVNINVKDFAGWTALHEACNHGWLSIADALIRFGADVNASGFGKDTPLHDAAINGHCDIVALLLKYGADPNQKNAKGKTPFDVARSEEVAFIIKGSFSGPYIVQQEFTSPRAREKRRHNWQRDFSPCHSTKELCHLTMRKNSPQNQVHKGEEYDECAEKPTSPRLTLRFQSIKPRDEKNSTSAKVNDLTSSPAKYPSYCVTMEAKGDVYEFDKEECQVSSSQSAVPDLESDQSVGNVVAKESTEPVTDTKSTVESNPESEMSLVVDKPESDEVNSAKVNGGRLSGDSCSKDRDYVSDTEKEESRRKRRRSNDSVQSRHSSVSHSSNKSHKSPSGKSAHSENHNEHRSSPKGKKKGSSSISDTESNISDSDMPDIMVSEGFPSSNHNGAFAAGLHSPKVPPLKIVIPSGSNSLESETRERSKVSSSKSALPYVVNSTEPMDTTMTETCTNSYSLESAKDGTRSLESTPSKLKDDSHLPEERFQRVTRSSQRIQAAMSNTTPNVSNDSSYSVAVSSSSGPKENSGESSNEDQLSIQLDVHPRKRKLRSRESGIDCANAVTPPMSSSESPNAEDAQPPPQQNQLQHLPNLQQPPQQQQQQQPQQLLNSYQMYLDIRKQVGKRRKAMFVVHPKPPQGFKDYLLNRCSYVLEGNAASRLSVPMISPPQSLDGSIKELFMQQEKERYRLRLQHLIEREKLVLSAEQEILRVHGRAARAMANQTVPLSACSVLKDEEIYNVLDADQEDKDKNVRSRYNGRLFLSWMQDIDDKWEKIKEAMLLRHHNEAESMHAVQKLDWEWKMKELAMCDLKTNPVIDDISVPMVHVSDDFDLLPI